MTTYTTNKNLALPAYNQTSPTWDVPLNSDFTIIDDAFGGTTSVSLTNVNVTLTQTQTQKACIKLTGTLTGNVTVYFPAAVSGYYLVNNATSGSYTVTLAFSGGAGPTITARQGVFNFVWADASTGGIYFASSTNVTAGSGITVTGSQVAIASPLDPVYGGTGHTTYTDGQLLIGNSLSGGLSTATLTAGSNITITNGNGTITIASSGGSSAFDPTISYTFTGTEVFNGTSSGLAATFKNFAQTFLPSFTAASGTVNFDVTAQTGLWYQYNATGNWAMNFRASSGTTLNAVMAVGQSVTVTFVASIGLTPYAVSGCTVDGSGASVLWQGGSAPSGVASRNNLYTFTIVKTSVSGIGVPSWSIFAKMEAYS